MIQSQEAQPLTISKLAAAGGVGVETIRFYQRKGLLEQPKRDTGIRRYSADDVRRLRFIKKAQSAGFTLQLIKELLDLDAGEDRSQARKLAQRQIEALDEKISDMVRARDALQRLARKCREVSSGPCPILGSFDL